MKREITVLLLIVVLCVLIMVQMAPGSHFLRLPSTLTPTAQAHSHSSLSPNGACFDIARSAAAAHAIDPTLYAKQINQESGCKDVTSPAGAQGYAQLMPAMSSWLHVDPHNMLASLNAGATLMASYLKAHAGSWPVALACYNAGTGATAQALAYGSEWLAHLPTETQRYIASIV